ncbi:tyrosine-type recombinase/integrase [Qipengyuania sp. NPDC077563]|uniref:tyrosine-type recombinase/integrase n=1 Tax=Qipengyuania sp. NPDC077563 TaxID=3364497 RepID=UPI00384F8613
MARTKITDKVVRELTPSPDGKQKIVRDEVIVGFAVRITGSGFISFVFNYVCNGVQRRLTIGSPPAWSVAAAREKAKQLRRQVDVGIDPLEDKRAARNEKTVDEVWQRYQREVLSKRAPKTVKDVTSIWDRLVTPTLGKMQITRVLAQDIESLHATVSEATPTQSNRMLASIQHMFTKSIHWGLVSHNPVKGIDRNPEERRVRFLSECELRRFLRALRKRPQTSSTLAIEFLMLTGARSGETFRAKWVEVDLRKAVWTKPSAHTKTKKIHSVPLALEAVEVLKRAQENRRSEFIFPGINASHIKSVKKAFAAILRDADITDFRIHDLRHSYASWLASENVPLTTIGRLLGHTQVSTTLRYSHLNDEVLRNATSIAGRRMRQDEQ